MSRSHIPGQEPKIAERLGFPGGFPRSTRQRRRRKKAEERRRAKRSHPSARPPEEPDL